MFIRAAALVGTARSAVGRDVEATSCDEEPARRVIGVVLVAVFQECLYFSWTDDNQPEWWWWVYVEKWVRTKVIVARPPKKKSLTNL